MVTLLSSASSRHPQLGRGEADRDRSVLGRRCCRARAADWLEVPQRLAGQSPIHVGTESHRRARRCISRLAIDTVEVWGSTVPDATLHGSCPAFVDAFTFKFLINRSREFG